MTPNEQIIHDLLTRQIDLMRYERSVRREVLQRLEAMRSEVEDKLRGQNLDEMGRRELAALLADIEAILSRDYDLIAGSLNTADVVEDESEWLFVWLGGMAAMYGLPEPKRLPETHKQALQNGLLVGGLTIAEAFAGQRDALMSRIRAQVRMAAVGGSDWESLKTDLQAAFKRAIQHAETTTATWISTIANQTTYWAGKANPWVKGYRHISVLDSKTSSVCTNRHGKLWDKQKQPQGHDFAFRVPPMHPNCRSRLVWVADLGDDFQGVIGEDWVKGRTLAQLQEQFGKGIGQMLHEGTISLHDAVRRGGLVPMTMRDLQRKYPKQADALKLRQALTKQAQGIRLSDAQDGLIVREWMGDALYRIKAGELENPRIKKLVKEYDLTQAEAVALRHYTGSGYRDLNAYLRGALPDRDLSDVVDIFQSALAKLPDYQGVVIRRDNLPLPMLQQYQLGNVVEYPAFTSATFGAKDVVINEKSPHRLKIDAVHAKRIDWISQYPKEDEVLFTAPTRFEVKTNPAINRSSGLLEIELEELP